MAALVAAYAAIVVCFRLLSFDALRSDVLDYWTDSLAWAQPFHPYHVPGFPWLLALSRTVTLDALPPLAVMRLVALAALLAGAGLVWRLLRDAGVGSRGATLGLLVFGLWPFVGLTYAALPVADGLAIALLLTGLLALCRAHPYVAALALGAALVTHKAAWPFAALLWLAWLTRPAADPDVDRGGPLRASIAATALLLAPLAVLWIWGTGATGSATWLVGANVSAEIAPIGGWPVADGLLGTLSAGGTRGLVKGVTVLAVVVVAAALTVAGRRLPEPYRRYGPAVAASVVLLGLVLNQHEVWAAVRFSKPLVVPLFWVLAAHQAAGRRPGLPGRMGTALLLLALAASQLAYAWYMARVFPFSG